MLELVIIIWEYCTNNKVIYEKAKIDILKNHYKSDYNVIKLKII